ncbi:MAG: hypothetical protein ACR2RF_16155 [Geminicoccaceae bacterium]
MTRTPPNLMLWTMVDQLIDGGTSPHHGHPMVWGSLVLAPAAV